MIELTSGQRKLLQFTTLLTTETKDGRAHWRAAPGFDRFSLVTARGSVVVRSMDADGQPPFEVALLNAEGVEIETLASYWDTGRTAEGQQFRVSAPWNSDLADLFDAARSNSINLEGVIDGILEEVRKPPTESADFTATDDDIPF
jgi:hypothetical protein